MVEIGDNYVSKMYRLDVELKEGSTIREDSFVIKSLEHTDPLLMSMGVYDTEKEIYVDVLPQFNKLWADAGEQLDFGPK